MGLAIRKKGCVVGTGHRVHRDSGSKDGYQIVAWSGRNAYSEDRLEQLCQLRISDKRSELRIILRLGRIERVLQSQRNYHFVDQGLTQSGNLAKWPIVE